MFVDIKFTEVLHCCITEFAELVRFILLERIDDNNEENLLKLDEDEIEQMVNDHFQNLSPKQKNKIKRI